MRRFKKILFVADGSKGEKSALSRAAHLAQLNKAKLTLIDALDVNNEPPLGPADRTLIQDLNKKLLADRRVELERLAASVKLSQAGLRVAAEVHTGRPAIAVIRSVLKDKHDLVIKAREGRAVLSGLFGTVDLKLMRKCPCPVWIIKPSRRKRYHQVLAAVDMDPGKPETKLLAEQIMEISTSLVKLEKAQLHVVHAWRLAGEAKLRGRQVTTNAVDKLLNEIRQAHKQELNTLVKGFSDSQMTIHLLKGRPGEVIPPLVGVLNIDLIVMGTVGRSGIPGFFIGNTAEKILNSVDCSVLTLKPTGFETPIEI